jgi:hypothetical protein
VSARLLEFHADRIDRAALLWLPQEDLRCLPHLFSGYVRYLRLQPHEAWVRQRAQMAALVEHLAAKSPGRTSEHLAMVVTAFVTFCDYLARVAPATAAVWGDVAATFLAAAPDIAEVQASRVREERVDEIVLRELARALREGKVCLQSGREPRRSSGPLLGSFDADFLYLIPDVTTRWASAEVRSRIRGLTSSVAKESSGHFRPGAPRTARWSSAPLPANAPAAGASAATASATAGTACSPRSQHAGAPLDSEGDDSKA